MLIASGISSLWAQNAQPNVIIINADDLGYGDISCNGTSSVKTPNVDRIAAQGIRFTNMYATSATSTPSRFSLLTGKYAWRVDGTGVAPGDAAMIVTPEMPTLPRMMQRAGYSTAAVGKWHLGLGAERGKQEWNGVIKPGLKEIGFEYSFIMAATADRVPCVYIENSRVVGLDPNDPIRVSYSTPFPGEPTGKNNPELLKVKSSHGHNEAIVNGVGRIGYMTGGKSALWVDQDIADKITKAAVNFIEHSAINNKPFFLYFATNDVHVPRVPHSRFVGKSGLGARGDAILEFDWSVGEILRTIESLGLTENTLIILTSDNGPVLDDGYQDGAQELLGNHKPGGNMRGGKYSIFDAGTCVPCVAQYPGRITKGTVSSAAVSHVDLYASLAALVGQRLNVDEAPDSQNMLAALLGVDRTGRDYVIQDAYTKSVISGDWKYIAPNAQGSLVAWQTGIETGNDAEPQLYNLKKDRGERLNVAQKYPKKVAELNALLQSELLGPKNLQNMATGKGSVADNSTSMLGNTYVVPHDNTARSLLSIMQQVPGLTVSHSGSSILVRVNGLGSINSGSGEPLVLLDNTQININTLTPEEIGSVTVLKDASSIMIYGDRGAYGVILIKSRKK